MRNKWKEGQRASDSLEERRTWVSLVLVILLCYWGALQTAQGQTTVTRYLNMNSNVISFDMLIAPPTLATVSASTSMKYKAEVSTAHISWSTVPDADQYKLMLYDNGAAQWNLIYDGAGQTHEMEGLTPGAHYVSIIACGGGLCGERSANAGVQIASNLDKDLDGVNNDNDLCPDTAQGVEVSAAGCEPSTEDTDDDGVTDDLDRCANTVAGEVANSRGCSPNQIDSDSDGKPDYQDAYPHQSALQCTP